MARGSKDRGQHGSRGALEDALWMGRHSGHAVSLEFGQPVLGCVYVCMCVPSVPRPAGCLTTRELSGPAEAAAGKEEEQSAVGAPGVPGP